MLTNNLIANIEKAILELERQKDDLIHQLEEHTWKDNRSHERFPGYVESEWRGFEDLVEQHTIPERAPLPPGFNRFYQQWFSSIRAIISKNNPVRLVEVDEDYKKAKDCLSTSHVSLSQVYILIDVINHQFDMLATVPTHLRYSTYDIELEAYSILSDDLLESANHLLSKGFARPAGVMAGVVLERHLKILLGRHSPPIKYAKNATLSTLNDLCKETVYELITWRKVQHLSDIRNLCAHDKTKEPTQDDVIELINGVSSLVHTCNI